MLHGSSQLTISRATLIAAVQAYLDGDVLATPARVVAVDLEPNRDSISASKAIVVKLEEPEASTDEDPT